jgi:hypothetical protein
MEVDEGFLRHVVEIIDASMQITRDKIVWQRIAISQLGESSQEIFEKTRNLPEMLTAIEIQLAELRLVRNAFATMVEKSSKGEPTQTPIDRIN